MFTTSDKFPSSKLVVFQLATSHIQYIAVHFQCRVFGAEC